jgi:hypothetical protein
VVLTIDHVTPVALGGSDKPDNLVAACKDCNAGKASIDPGSALVVDVAKAAMLWGIGMEAAATLRSQDRDARDEYVAAFDEAWLCWRITAGRLKGDEIPRPGGWACSVWTFYEALLPLDELRDAIQIAASNSMVGIEDKWRYMCGVAWKQLVEIQEIAKKELTDSTARVAARTPEVIA